VVYPILPRSKSNALSSQAKSKIPVSTQEEILGEPPVAAAFSPVLIHFLPVRV
jgi:hypothetical protein